MASATGQPDLPYALAACAARLSRRIDTEYDALAALGRTLARSMHAGGGAGSSGGPAPPGNPGPQRRRCRARRKWLDQAQAARRGTARQGPGPLPKTIAGLGTLQPGQ